MGLDKSKVKDRWNKLMNDLTKYKIVAVLIIFYLILGTKTLLFDGLISIYSKSFKMESLFFFTHMAFIFIILSPFLFLKGKNKLRFLIIVNFLYSTILCLDAIYFKGTETFLGIRNIVFPGLTAWNWKIDISDLVYIMFFIDIPLLILWNIKDKTIKLYRRFIIMPISIIITCILVIYSTYYLIDIKEVNNGESKFMQIDWCPFMTIRNMSPLGYHFFEGIDIIKNLGYKVSEDDLSKVDKWLQWNKEDLPDNEYKGMFKGKNVIFIQFESLEQFIINKKIDNQEITPNINKLIKNGLYFPNIYEQNNFGNSADCDFMVNSSILPLGDSITFLSHPEVKYPSFARKLQEKGYTTISSHVEGEGSYNWAENHRYSFGVENIWGISEFNIKEKVGGYNSDREYLGQSADKLKDIKKPFYSLFATGSSHGPFYMEEEYKYLSLSDELNKNRLGEYIQSVHYSDKQVGLFIDKLEKEHLLDDTVIVLYGDHGGVHKYYSDMIENAPLKEAFWKEDNMKVPLVIFSKDMKSNVIDANGGLIDVVPTMLYLLGEDYDNLMGRNLLNTNRNATIMTDRDKNHLIKGTPKSEEEIEKLQEAYDIGNIIIKERYYERRGLVK